MNRKQADTLVAPNSSLPRRSVDAVPSPKEVADLYEQDETAWLELMSRLIGEKRHDRVDFDNLASYLIDMAQRDRREVNNRLLQLMLHLLKWISLPPSHRTRSWFNTIKEQRYQLQQLLRSKVLEQHAQDQIAEIYNKARQWAQEETGKTGFPKESYTLDQIKADGFPADLAWEAQRRRKKK